MNDILALERQPVHPAARSDHSDAVRSPSQHGAEFSRQLKSGNENSNTADPAELDHGPLQDAEQSERVADERLPNHIDLPPHQNSQHTKNALVDMPATETDDILPDMTLVQSEADAATPAKSAPDGELTGAQATVDAELTAKDGEARAIAGALAKGEVDAATPGRSENTQNNAPPSATSGSGGEDALAKIKAPAHGAETGAHGGDHPPREHVDIPTGKTTSTATDATSGDALTKNTGTIGAAEAAQTPAQSPTSETLSTAPAPAKLSADMRTQPATIVASTAALGDVIAKSVPTGNAAEERVVVQLDPPELGRVALDFKFDAAGLQHISIITETPEALRQLRLMHFELINALEKFGLSTENMSFHQQHSEAGDEHGAQQSLFGNAASDEASGEVQLVDTYKPRAPTINHDGRVDIQI